MKTVTIKVHFYKDTGKWYSSDKFVVEDLDMTDPAAIEKEIERRHFGMSRMAYTFKASNGSGAVNRRLVPAK